MNNQQEKYSMFRTIRAWCILKEFGIPLKKMPRKMKKAERSHLYLRDTKGKRRLFSYMNREIAKIEPY